MMTLFAALIVAIGLFSILYRRTIMGLVIGSQCMLGGIAVLFLFAGNSLKEEHIESQVFCLAIVLVSLLFTAVFLSLAYRLFRLRGRTELNDIEELRG